MAAPYDERMKRVDTDGNGKLTQEELRVMHEEMRKHMPELRKGE